MNARIETPWERIDPETLWEYRDDRRFYRAGDVALPAVSTILDETADRRFGLEAWERNLGAKGAAVVRSIAIARGRRLHSQIADYTLHGREPERPDVWWRSVELVVRQLATSGRTLLCEGAVINLLGGYGGTPDDVVEIGGRLFVVDWKTSAVPRSIEILREYEDQVAAYIDAIEAHYGVRPTDGLVAVALPDRRAQVHRVDVDAATERWRDRLAEYYG